MDEDLKKYCIADNDEFGLLPGKLLQEEIHFRGGHTIELTRALYHLCENLAVHYKPFAIASGVDFDYVRAKVHKNLFYKEAYGGFEPTEFREATEFNPTVVNEEEMDLELLVFKKGYRSPKKQKPVRKFSAKDVVFPDSEKPLTKEEKKLWIEREREIFQEANYLCVNGIGMYDVYYSYSNVELKTKEDYNFFIDGYEFNDIKLSFAFKLRQIEKDSIRSFFKYQLKVNFQSDKEEFKDFVKSIIDGYNEPDFFPSYIIKPVNDFLGENYMCEVKSINVQEKLDEDNIKQKDTAIRTKATKYILQSLSCTAKIDEQIKFIRYLLGKDETKEVDGTNEDKAFQNNETKKTKGGKIKDLEKVIELFNALKLTEPLRLAQMDLNRLKK